MSTHHRYSPSKLERKAACPGCIDDPEGDTTRADEGSLCHRAAELEDLSILETEEQRFTVQKVLDYVKPFTIGAIEDLKEVKLQIMGGLLSGTADRVIVRKAKVGVHVDVPDFKFGYGSVSDASVNPQVISYVIGVFERWPEAQSVRGHIILPRRDEVFKHTFFRKDLDSLRVAIRQIIDQCEKFERTQDASMLVPSDACTYCGRRGTCPALSNYAVTLAKRYEPLTIVEEVHSSQLTDPVKAAQYLTILKVLEKMVDSAKKHITDLAMQNGGLPGYVIAEKSGVRKINDIPAAYEVLKEYLSPEEIILESNISLTGVLDRAGEKAPPRGKSKLRGEIEKKLADANAVSYGEPSRFLKRAKD